VSSFRRDLTSDGWLLGFGDVRVFASCLANTAKAPASMSFNYDEAVDSWGQRTRSRTRAHGRLSMAAARCAPVFTVLIRVRFPNVGNLHIHTSSVAHSSAACANLGVRALARFRFVRTSRLQTIAEQVARDRAVTFACVAYGLLFLMRPTRAPFVRGLQRCTDSATTKCLPRRPGLPGLHWSNTGMPGTGNVFTSCVFTF
jgi:hypothetical protein